MLFILRMRRGESTPLEDTEHTINLSLFIAVCLLELFYVFSMGANSIWFCTPDKIGWLWTIINFFIFGAVVFNQWMCFFNTLNDVQYNSYATFNWSIFYRRMKKMIFLKVKAERERLVQLVKG